MDERVKAQLEAIEKAQKDFDVKLQMLNYDGDKKGKSLSDAIEKKIQSMDLNLTARVEAMAAAPAAVVKKQLE